MAIVLRLLACATLMVYAEGGIYEYYNADSHFNCLRRNHTCKNGAYCDTVDVYEARCICSGDDTPFYGTRRYAGYDCSINVTDTYDYHGYVSDDNCPCQNYVSCYKSRDNATCHCSPDYFGEHCSKNRVKVECESHGMYVWVNPIEPFEGKVYLGNDSNNPECLLRDNHFYPDYGGFWDQDYRDNRDYWDYRFARFRDNDGFANNCNLFIANHTHGENVNTSYTRILTIQYDPDIQIGLDLVINVTCIHHENGTWLTESSFTADRSSQPNGKDIVATFFPVSIYFWHDTDVGSKRINSIYLGQRIVMGNILETNVGNDGIMVDSCTFTNSNGKERMTVIENGCPTAQALPIDLTELWHLDNPLDGVMHEFRAFRFGSDPVLRVFCRVRLCKEYGDPICAQPDCDSRRKKREAGDDNDDDDDDDDGEMMGSSSRRRRMSLSGEDGTISQTLNVLDPYDESENAEAFQVTADKCMAEPVVKSVGISLIAVVAVLLLVSIGLAICVCRMTMTKREMGLRMKLKHLQDNNYSKAGGGGGLSNIGFE